MVFYLMSLSVVIDNFAWDSDLTEKFKNAILYIGMNQ